MVGSIVVVGALTHCPLLYSMCHLKTTRINVESSLIWNLGFTSLNWAITLQKQAKVFIV